MKPNRISLILLSLLTFFAVSFSSSLAQDLRPGPNIAGTWTIYADNVDKPGSSLKTIQVTQNGNIISGIFHGPNQHGKFQGWINGNHIRIQHRHPRRPHLPRPNYTARHVRYVRHSRPPRPVESRAYQPLMTADLSRTLLPLHPLRNERISL